MSRYFPRARIHCHTAFHHYEMYHCGKESSYGNSVFNTTYNFNGGNICGGGFMGGFWGGIGMGIGNFLGGILGNFMGGFGFGGCFGGGFGLSQYNMMTTTPFSIFGNSNLYNPANFWNIGNKNKDADGAGGKERPKTVTVEKDCEDKDLNIIIGFQKRAKDLLKTNDKKEALNLYNDIAAKIKQPADESHKDENISIYKGIIDSLKEAGYTFTLEDDNDPYGKATAAEESDKNKVNKLLENKTSGIGNVKNTHEEEYKAGFSNVTEEELNDIQGSIDIIDTSGNVSNIIDAEIIKFNNSDKTINVKSQSGINIEYTYVGKTKYNENVYASDKHNQCYILQKNSDGKLSLVQYSWNTGIGTPDIVNENQNTSKQIQQIDKERILKENEE